MTQKIRAADLGYCVRIVRNVCDVSGPRTLIQDIRDDLAQDGILKAVRKHDTAKLFSWLLRIFSFQGISDRAAVSFLDRYGAPELEDLYASLAKKPRCSLLHSYWQFTECGYRKSAKSCNHRHLLSTCPLPRHQLRNGRLNQTAYSLALFLRDVVHGDLVQWLEHRVRTIRNKEVDINHAVIGPLSQIHGVSDKVVRLAISDLYLGAHRSTWRDIGARIVVVDSLVHNFLHRSGILKRLNAEHNYGPYCYQNGGCAVVVEFLSKHIDARAYNHTYPSYFPRFIQKAIWNYCANDEFDICNGNQIDDRSRCRNSDCSFYEVCDRIKLTSIKSA